MEIVNTVSKRILPVIALGLTLLLGGCVTATVGVVTVSTIDVVRDQRTVGTILDDNIIEATIFKDIVTDPALDNTTHISTTVVNGVALLTGEVSNEEQKLRAAKIANSYQGVDQVVNELAILGKSSFTSRTNDSLITAKVKTELLRSKEVNASNIKVVTERSVVYLMGIVGQQEGDMAVNLAKQVGGVQRIVKIFMPSA